MRGQVYLRSRSGGEGLFEHGLKEVGGVGARVIDLRFQCPTGHHQRLHSCPDRDLPSQVTGSPASLQLPVVLYGEGGISCEPSPEDIRAAVAAGQLEHRGYPADLSRVPFFEVKRYCRAMCGSEKLAVESTGKVDLNRDEWGIYPPIKCSLPF